MKFYDPFYGVFEDVIGETIIPTAATRFPVTTVKYDCNPKQFIDYGTRMPKVKSVIFNKEATIVYFNDGTKCIVRKSDKDEYNREHAVVYAIVKRAYGKVGPDGVVDGNGMGNMLEKIVANGYDQEAHNAAERAKKEAKLKKQTTETVAPWPGQEDLCESCNAVDCADRAAPYKMSDKQKRRETANKLPSRDKSGRFVKKANRNKNKYN